MKKLFLIFGFLVTMPAVARVSKDFAAYLRGDDDYAENVRCRIRDRLCTMLRRNERVLLISQGTGSAIVYDILWQLSHDRSYRKDYEASKIDLWLTLGSPLGDSNIRKRLMGAKEKLAIRFPNNVIAWHNVAAEDDFTCHDATLADDFKKMLNRRAVSAVHDYTIYNLTVRYGRSNPHSSIGYFIHPRIAKIIVDWIADEQG